MNIPKCPYCNSSENVVIVNPIEKKTGFTGKSIGTGTGAITGEIISPIIEKFGIRGVAHVFLAIGKIGNLLSKIGKVGGIFYVIGILGSILSKISILGNFLLKMELIIGGVIGKIVGIIALAKLGNNIGKKVDNTLQKKYRCKKCGVEFK